MVRHEAKKLRLNELAYEACIDEPTIERYKTTEYYARDIYTGKGGGRKLLHKAGDVRHKKGEPVRYYKGKRTGQPKMRYELDPAVVGEILQLIYPYCRKSVVNSFGWEDLELITNLQIWVVDMLRREGPTPLGKPFADMLPLRVNNYLTYKFQRAKAKGLTRVVETRNGAGEIEEIEVLVHPWARKKSLDEVPPGFREPFSSLIGKADPSFEMIEVSELFEALRERVSPDARESIEDFLDGEIDKLPPKTCLYLRSELTHLMEGARRDQ